MAKFKSIQLYGGNSDYIDFSQEKWEEIAAALGLSLFYQATDTNKVNPILCKEADHNNGFTFFLENGTFYITEWLNGNRVSTSSYACCVYRHNYPYLNYIEGKSGVMFGLAQKGYSTHMRGAVAKGTGVSGSEETVFVFIPYNSIDLYAANNQGKTNVTISGNTDDQICAMAPLVCTSNHIMLHDFYAPTVHKGTKEYYLFKLGGNEYISASTYSETSARFIMAL